MAEQLDVRLNIQYETIAALKKELKIANNELENAKVNTVEWTNAFKRVGQLKGQMQQVNMAIRQSVVATQQSQRSSSNAAVALMNLNYVVRDSPYFFNNFALGVLAVGNNINPLIDSFSRLRMEAKAAGETVSGNLKKALVGGAGISIAFSVVVTAIQAFVFQMSRAKKGIDLVTEAVQELASELIEIETPFEEGHFSFNREQAEDAIRILKEEIKLVKESDQYAANVQGIGIMLATQLGFYKSKELKTNEEIVKEFEKQIARIQARLLIEDKLSKTQGKFVKDEEKKTKELKKQKGYVADIKKLLEEMYEILTLSPAERFIRRAQASFQAALPFAGRQDVDKPEVQGMKEFLEGIKLQLKAIEGVANVAGNAISNAFLSGKNAIDAAVQALKQFIIQLAVVQSFKALLTAIFTPLSFGQAFVSGITGQDPFKKSTNTNFPGKGGGTIQVEGNLRAESNEFIAGFEKAKIIYNRNVKGKRLGR